MNPVQLKGFQFQSAATADSAVKETRETKST